MTKHVFKSKTQILVVIGLILTSYNLYARMNSIQEIELSPADLASLGTGLVFILVSIDRMLPKKGLHFFKGEDV